jgi:hypothetical protein
MLKCYVVSMIPRPGVSTEEVETALNARKDWIRFRKNTWLVATRTNADVLYSSLWKFVKPEGELFVGKLDLSERSGWMTKSFWTWLKEIGVAE